MFLSRGGQTGAGFGGGVGMNANAGAGAGGGAGGKWSNKKNLLYKIVVL